MTELLTRAEATNYQETSRHADVLAFAADPQAALLVLSQRGRERGATG